ncbi:MAG TPA: MMPL family transporter [Thermoleophilaceae bacterium]
MSSYLYRLGRWAFRRRRVVLGFWLALLVGMGVLSQAVKKDTNDAFNVPGTESQRALDLLDEKFPGSGGATARIVFAAPEGHTLDEPQYRKVVDPTVERAQAVPQSVTTGEQFLRGFTPSKDKTIGFADLHFAVPVEDLKDSTKEALERVADPARKAGLEVEFSGGVISTSEEETSAGEQIGVLVAFIVLLVSFGSALIAGLPLVTAIIGVAIGLSGIFALTAVTELNSTAPTLATMLGLAVGIDYALFIVSRHRQQLADGLDPAESVARATATAGSAVVFAGVTVLIALVGLLVVGIPFLSVMGLAAAGTVAIAVLIALTLLPALLGFAGKRAGRGRRPATGATAGLRWAQFVTRRPLVAIGAVIAVLAAVALPALDLRQGLPDDSIKPKDTTERRSYELLTQGFGPGFTGPLTTVIDFGGREDAKAIAQDAAKELRDFPGVAAASDPVFNESGQVAIIIVTPTGSPSSDATKDLVARMRDTAADIRHDSGINAMVTGTTAINIDTSDKLTAALPVFLVLVVGLALLLLTLVFRSIPVPLKAAAGFLLTIAASLGAVCWIFQQGNLADVLAVSATGPIVSFLPVLMIAILFGLAMDYEVFLVSRMRESYVHTGRAREATVSGFQASARVVTAAALIMIAVFSGFIVSNDVVIKSIGFALAFGVLVDAFLVRMTLVPAVLALLDRRAWWLPRWMDRRMPNLDIEGEKLLHELEPATSAEPAREPTPAGH